jgi:hypothetical protein
LKANESGELKAEGNTFPIVVSPAILATLGVGGSYTQSAARTSIFKFSSTAGQIVDREDCRVDPYPHRHPFISGDVGFKTWLERVMTSTADRKLDARAPYDLQTISNSFQFTVAATAGLSSSFSITPSMRTTTLAPALGGDREDDHVVAIAMTAPEPSKSAVSSTQRTVSAAQVAQANNLATKARVYDVAAAALEKQSDPSILATVRSKQVQDAIEPLIPSRLAADPDLSVQALVDKGPRRLRTDATVARREAESLRSRPDVTTTVTTSVQSVPTSVRLNEALVQQQLERLNTTLGRFGRF